MLARLKTFLAQGWVGFPADPATLAWARAALAPARAAMADPAYAPWWRCGGTWFAGVNALPNDKAGSIGGVPLAGAAVDFIRQALGQGDIWDRAQVSACLPGYPRQGNETDAAFAYRRDRDAAHVDGLLKVAPDGRRMLRERHGFILGLPLTKGGAGASPTVIWEGSHEVMRHAFTAQLHERSDGAWENIDLTACYHSARREVFRDCARVEIAARPGEAFVIHRLALHGIAPWDGAQSADRLVAFLRPELPGPAHDWLMLP